MTQQQNKDLKPKSFCSEAKAQTVKPHTLLCCVRNILPQAVLFLPTGSHT